MNSKIAIVILNWNGAKLMKQFLPSVIEFSKYQNAKIFVADNGSTDDSLSILKKEFPEVNLIELKQNYGFAQGYNEAVQQIESDYFVILNSDVEVSSGWLESPIQLMEEDKNIAAVQPKILNYHQKTHFEYAGAAGGFIDRFGYPFCRGRVFNELEADIGQYNDVKDIFWATGACMFVRSQYFHNAGGFDADFWAHMEEIDLCWRLKNIGYRIVYTPQSTVYHLGGGTLSYDNPQKLLLNFRNNLWLLYKNLPGNKFFSVIFIRMILDGAAAFKLLFEGNFRGFWSVARAHAQFYLSLPELHKKRQLTRPPKNTNLPEEMLRKSIVFQFYMLKKKRFSDIN